MANMMDYNIAEESLNSSWAIKLTFGLIIKEKYELPYHYGLISILLYRYYFCTRTVLAVIKPQW